MFVNPNSLSSSLRLVFQGSIPFDDHVEAENWYKMLKEMVRHKSDNSTLNGQVMKMLEPCCGKSVPKNLSGGVSNVSP